MILTSGGRAKDQLDFENEYEYFGEYKQEKFV